MTETESCPWKEAEDMPGFFAGDCKPTAHLIKVRRDKLRSAYKNRCPFCKRKIVILESSHEESNRHA